jgi:hypothetical protein
MNSNQGIYRVRKQELNDFADGKVESVTSVSYGPEDGLQEVEGNSGKQPAGLKAKDGKLWFPRDFRSFNSCAQGDARDRVQSPSGAD